MTRDYSVVDVGDNAFRCYFSGYCVKCYDERKENVDVRGWICPHHGKVDEAKTIGRLCSKPCMTCAWMTVSDTIEATITGHAHISDKPIDLGGFS